MAPNGHRGLTVNQPVAVGIHPEYVLIARGPGQNAFPGSLDRMVDAITSVSCP